MKNKELQKLLATKDPELEIIVETSSGCSPLSASLWIGAYKPETTYSGEAGLLELTEEEEKLGYSEEDVLTGKGVIKAIFLTSIN